MSKANIITGVVVVTGIVGAYALLVKLGGFQNELVIIPTARIHKIDLKNLTIRLDLHLKNPTKSHYIVKFPFVKLIYKDVVIGSSTVVDQDIEIPRYGEARIEKIMIDVPLGSLFSVAATIIKAIQNKEPVTIKADIKTTIALGVITMPVRTVKDIIIKS